MIYFTINLIKNIILIKLCVKIAENRKYYGFGNGHQNI